MTKSGGTTWHGDGYFYLKNEALNANDFQRNWQGLGRLPFRENQIGFQIGGPTPIRGLFTSTLVEYTSDRAWEDATAVAFPTPAYIAGLMPGSLAAQILGRYAPPTANASGNALIRKPDTVNRTIALERVDYAAPSGKDRLYR